MNPHHRSVEPIVAKVASGDAFLARHNSVLPQPPLVALPTMTDSLSALTRQIVSFRDAREWAQFHDPKNLALALSIEAAELNEHFLWKEAGDARAEGVYEELADVLIYALLLAHHYGADAGALVRDKLRVNEEKYPVERPRGRADKYTDL